MAQIWDTAGQEQFQYRGADAPDACILVFDLTEKKSFDNLDTWREEFLVQSGPPNSDSFPFVVLGNKCDLKHLQAVLTDDAKQFAEQNNLAFIETSALDASGVDIAFQNILTEIYRLMNKKQLASEGAQKATVSAGEKISLGGGDAEGAKKKKCGCN